jgi:hypothetical protein
MVESPERADLKGQMLPGIAAICIFMVLLTTINVWACLNGIYGSGVPKYGILTVCSFLAVGILGLLRLKKWGWALVTAGCLLFAAGDFFYFSKTHLARFFVRGLFVLMFFLYLARPETRDHLQ